MEGWIGLAVKRLFWSRTWGWSASSSRMPWAAERPSMPWWSTVRSSRSGRKISTPSISTTTRAVSSMLSGLHAMGAEAEGHRGPDARCTRR